MAGELVLRWLGSDPRLQAKGSGRRALQFGAETQGSVPGSVEAINPISKQQFLLTCVSLMLFKKKVVREVVWHFSLSGNDIF